MLTLCALCGQLVKICLQRRARWIESAIEVIDETQARSEGIELGYGLREETLARCRRQLAIRSASHRLLQDRGQGLESPSSHHLTLSNGMTTSIDDYSPG
jgi:hypothetical protein